MRAYFFTSMYLSSIQQGIQAQHCTASMFVRYQTDEDGKQMLYDWATDHKTTIVLNGGYSSELRDLFNMFNVVENPYPFESWCESEEALDGAMTCVGIILPEHIYKLAALVRSHKITKEAIRTYTASWLESDPEHDHLGMSLAMVSSGTFNVQTAVAQLAPFERELIIRMNKYGLAS